MDDAEVIATISAGDLDGLAAVLNRYAERLYDYCYPMAPEDAAQVVEDTFIVAWTKLDELRDPSKLYPWLQAVASNECFRRRLARGLTGPPDSVPSILWMPTEVPGRVLSACADNTPLGRARRVSATHRAGPFGFDGFPKTGHRPGALRKRLRHPLAIASMTGVAAAVTAAAVAAGIGFGQAGPPHHAEAAGLLPHHPVSPVAASGAELPTTPATQIPATVSSPQVNSPSRQAPSAPATPAPATPTRAATSGTAVVSAAQPSPAAHPVPVVSAAPAHHGKGQPRQHGNGGGNGKGHGNGNGNGGNSKK